MAGEDNFLSRWSRRKTRSRNQAGPQPEAPALEPTPTLEPAPARPSAPAAADAPPAPAGRAPLPPVESLTPESDFAPFMAPDVDGDVRRQALKTLFSDPRFNTMDMMDVYVDDYSKPDPIPESWMGKLEQLSRLGDRAGRDREEEERRKALAEAQAETPDAAAESPPVTAAPPPPPLEKEGESPGSAAEIPALPARDSRT